MCYSARVWMDWRKYLRLGNPPLDLGEFLALFSRWRTDTSIKLPKAMVDAFTVDPRTGIERRIAALIAERRADDAIALQQALFAQRRRLADAERALQARTTKTASESRRIATDKIGAIRRQLDDLGRTEPLPDDARIFPGSHAPVVVGRDGRRSIVPMRYQCRPAGKPAGSDRRFPGTYNARRDNLQGFWRGQFGRTHAILVVTRFFENVARPEGNVVLEFAPQPDEPMFVACLWSRWTPPDGAAGEQPLLSFAAITDEPPAEIAAAGHDRCIVAIRSEHVDAWLSPSPGRLDALQAILDDRAPLHYTHRRAA